MTENAATVMAQGATVTSREEDHLVKFAKPQGHEASRIEGLERASSEPGGRLRVTVGKRVADLLGAEQEGAASAPK